MNDNDRLEEQVMDSNRKRMRELNKLFSLTFYVCAVHFIIRLVLDIIGIGVALMTLGVVSENPFMMLFRFMGHLVIMGAFLWSYMKDRTGTIASIAAIVIWLMIGLAIGGTVILDYVLAALWIGLQVLCLTKYKELEYLKAQPGYPDFNAIFLHKTDNRRVTDVQIKESLRENRSVKNAPADEAYPISEKTVMNDDGSGFMEILNVDAGMLADKNDAGYENHYMDDISADDINAGAGHDGDSNEHHNN